jgi:hypothetical protein
MTDINRDAENLGALIWPNPRATLAQLELAPPRRRWSALVLGAVAAAAVSLGAAGAAIYATSHPTPPVDRRLVVPPTSTKSPATPAPSTSTPAATAAAPTVAGDPHTAPTATPTATPTAKPAATAATANPTATATPAAHILYITFESDPGTYSVQVGWVIQVDIKDSGNTACQPYEPSVYLGPGVVTKTASSTSSDGSTHGTFKVIGTGSAEIRSAVPGGCPHWDVQISST